MRLLLDTNVLIQSIAGALRPDVMDMLDDPANELFVSHVSLWEIAIKSGLGKLRVPDDLDVQVEQLGIIELPLSRPHLAAYRELPLLHRDPFDRMLVTQARIENLILVTSDRQLAEYDVTVLPA
ncbi:type II toxin-antitoxin system VapC family toxin [Ferrovibrio terrae]|uniref:Type II toxin-antitoxin system VapC family toxin n=1 Tax=Ferrovibrio terrae TaxID=2594003 RepID=A0A516GZG4_9PROT|nr:type II toxin-antitoxin system VapC family toxin [Ferrovibrio terrae]QDO96921.1 type II toxin-antitoxin system VapC family toxin [Ferrovibrio terrae]